MLGKITKMIKAGIRPAFFVLPLLPVIAMIGTFVKVTHFLYVHFTGYRAETYDTDAWWMSHFFEPSLITIILLVCAGKHYRLLSWYCVLELFVLWNINTLHMALNFDIANYYCAYLSVNMLALIVFSVNSLTRG